MTSLADDMQTVGHTARAAARRMAVASPAQKRTALLAIASDIRGQVDALIDANARDVETATERGLSAAMIDRLRLTSERIEGVAAGVEAIADQADPVGGVLESWDRPNGLHFRKVAVPIGVIGMIYESRPNVTVDAAALCIRSGNAVILRGGSEAVNSNRAFAEAIATGLRAADLPIEAVQLLRTQSRDAVGLMLQGLGGSVDMLIPRGGKGLVARVQSDARVPVLAHLEGLNHSYVHASADLGMALDVVTNAKMRRTGVCGAMETVLVDRAIGASFIPLLVDRLTELGCELRGDPEALTLDPRIGAATEQDFATEHSAPILNVAVIECLDDALAHIARYASGHTDAILASDEAVAARFLAEVDSAIVLHNASTQFADGGEFGFGAEIGIATGRLHARGPVGAQHLTTYKYNVIGQGTVRP